MMRGSWGAVAVLLAARATPRWSRSRRPGFNGVITFLNDRQRGKQDTFVQTPRATR